MRFPHYDLDMAIRTCRAAPDPGKPGLSLMQFAIRSGHSSETSTIRQKLSSAKMFGLVESNDSLINKTDLGMKLCQGEKNIKLCRQAFFNCKLYSALINRFSKVAFPNSVKNQNEAFVNFGVSEKSADKARISFRRSAEFAEIFVPAGGFVKFSEIESQKNNNNTTQSYQSFSNSILQLFLTHRREPVIGAIVSKIPEGENWPREKRKEWLAALESSLDLIYNNDPKNEG